MNILKNNRTFNIGFLVYCSRSGSTLLSRFLNSFSDICMTIEGDLPPELFGVKSTAPVSFKNHQMFTEYLMMLINQSKMKTWGIDEQQIINEFSESDFPIKGIDLVKTLLFLYLQKNKQKAKIVIYKGPPIMPWEVGSLINNFPNAKIIHILRDPRAVYNSQKNNLNPYDNLPFTSSPLQTANEWKKSIEHINKLHTPNIQTINFENLIDNSEKVLDNLCEFLQVSVEKNQETDQNSFVEKIPVVEKDIHSRIGKNPESNRIDIWKENISKKEIYLIEQKTGILLENSGYEKFLDYHNYKIKNYLIFIRETIILFFVQISKRIVRIVNGFRLNRKFYVIKLKSRLQNFL